MAVARLPEIIVSTTNYHQAVFSPQLLPEILNGVGVALHGVLADHKQHGRLHVQQRVIYILNRDVQSIR